MLALEKGLSIQDQVILYGHAVGHLLLNSNEAQLGQRLMLDPRNGFAHADTLAELRLIEMVKQRLDQRVLETFPLLTKLLEVPEESAAAFNAATTDLRQQLVQVGWSRQFLQMPYQFTDGRVFPSSPRRGTRLFVDALLRAAPSLPIAIVHTLRSGEVRDDAIRRLQSYARLLAVPFAYLLEEHGTLLEFDRLDPGEVVRSSLLEFPARETLWERWSTALKLTELKHKRVLQYPYRMTGNRTLRYYQEAAINGAVIAVLQALLEQRSPRILLTLATGTGKTLVAFQLLWKLKRERAVKNVLFLTDRDFLLSQAMDNEFAPFGDGRYRIQRGASTSYDVNFATYQGITSSDENDRMLYLSYQSNFFDVIVIDECHRGSAKETSEWRKVLEYFSSAVQIGLTATPLKDDIVQTDAYFGESLYKYSLRMGMNDGFLAPYRVRRVMIGQSPDDESALLSEEPETPSGENTLHVAFDEDELSFIDIPPSMELPGTMITSTKTIAQHLAAFLQRTDPFAKTIVFCVDQAHAEEMRVALEEACLPWAPANASYIVRIVSDEGTEGKYALGNFSATDERFPVVVTTSKLLSTGVDVPTCKNIVLARPIGSIVEFKQIIGRGTRLFEPQKRWFTILDYAGTIKHFFDPDFDGDPELVEKEVLVPEPAPDEVPATPDEISPGEVIFSATPQSEQASEEVTREEESQPTSYSRTDAPANEQQQAASPEIHEEHTSYLSAEACHSTQTSASDLPPFTSRNPEGASRQAGEVSQGINDMSGTPAVTEGDVPSGGEETPA
ncbi:MAG TPA: DEAD/DEAH box helicase family protein, partial [Ktedonobacteraceae bacterium]|nr:DEAD/DEAH box helicase family protein [Ktedonobacteraceae bacterium]